MGKVRVVQNPMPTKNLGTVRLLHFFVREIIGRCHILGLKGYGNIIKKQPEDSAWGDAHALPWGGNFFTERVARLENYAKKGTGHILQYIVCKNSTLICVDPEGCCIFAITGF